MAEKLVKIYNSIGQEGGLNFKMRLAVMTGVPSNKAADVPDTPDVVTKFVNAFKEITGKNAPLN